MSLLTCHELSFAYEGRTVLTDLSFSVEKGECLCIFGENGAGKTTLLQGLAGLHKPTASTITAGEGLLPRQIGYLPQQTPAQRDFPAGVGEVVRSGRLNRCGLRPFYSQEDRRAAAEALRLLGLEGLEKSCYRQLSGGQQQRVLLARALCATETLLLLDEPISGLDPPAAAELYRLIGRLKLEKGIAVVMVSHDVRGALPLADHVLCLDGHTHFYGTREAWLATAQGQRFAGGADE